nr:unnamed protein product [Digitaria exilis]
MSGLMQMEDELGKKLCDDEVVDNIVSLVVAGYESTANATMWAAYHLAKSPHAENAAISRDKNGGFITLDDIPSMKYTAKVNNLASTLHAGYTIPKGWRVVVWLRSLHTDPNYYDDPLSFNPTDGTWELLNPDAEISYLPHSKPVDGAAMSFSKLNSD